MNSSMSMEAKSAGMSRVNHELIRIFRLLLLSTNQKFCRISRISKLFLINFIIIAL